MKNWMIGLTAVLTLSLVAGCGGGGAAAYCDEVEKAEEYFKSFNSDDFPDGGEFADIEKAFTKVADAAPSEIRDDWKVMNELVGVLLEVFEQHSDKTGDVDDENVEQFFTALGEAMDSLDQDEVEAAGERIEKYTQDECGIDLDE